MYGWLAAFVPIAGLLLAPGCISHLYDYPEVRVQGAATGYLARVDDLRLDVDTGRTITWTVFKAADWHLYCVAGEMDDEEDVDLTGLQEPITSEVAVKNATLPEDIRSCSYQANPPTPEERRMHKDQWVNFRADLLDNGETYVELTAAPPETPAPDTSKAIPSVPDPAVP